LCSYSDVEDVISYVKRILTDILVQDLKNYFEQYPRRWERCKELEGDYFEIGYHRVIIL
jgi:hypothetical protein